MRSIVLTAAATAAFLWIVADASTAGPGAAEERAPVVDDAAAAAGWTAQGVPQVQGEREKANADGDDRVPVQVWTVLAAGGAASVGLLLFLLRLAIGWVKPPPRQEEGHH